MEFAGQILTETSQINDTNTSSEQDRSSKAVKEESKLTFTPTESTTKPTDLPEEKGSSDVECKPRPRTSSSKTEMLKKKKRLEEEKSRIKEQESREQQGQASTEVASQGLTDPQTEEANKEMPPPPADRTKSNESQSSNRGKSNAADTVETRDRRSAAAVSASDKYERLTKLVEALRKKNQRLESENSQLEEVISSLDKKNKDNEEEIKKLNGSMKQLIKSKQETEDRAALLQAKVDEGRALSQNHESVIQSLQQKLTEKEKESATATAERNASETHIISSLRKDVEAAESLLENERKAHALTRRNFASREQELGESISKAANALSESQAKSDDYSRKFAESHDRCIMLEAEVDSLSRQLKAAQSMPGIVDPSSQVSQERVKELEIELDTALRDAANSKGVMKSLEDDMSRIQSENFALKQQLAKFESSDSLELQKRLTELTQTLYAKQSQIETLAAEKGALQMQLDREFSASRSDSIRRRATAVEKMFSGDSYDNVVPMQALGAGYERLANAPGHLGGAVQAGAKLLDTAALQAVILIRQSPLWRLGVFVYLMGMHALMYVLLFFHSHHGLPHSNTIMDSAAVHSN